MTLRIEYGPRRMLQLIILIGNGLQCLSVEHAYPGHVRFWERAVNGRPNPALAVRIKGV